VINSVVEPRKKYLFAVVVTVALVTAVLVYLCPRDHGYLAAITALAILLGMLVALSILSPIFVASAKLLATEQSFRAEVAEGSLAAGPPRKTGAAPLVRVIVMGKQIGRMGGSIKALIGGFKA
jgi:hypothetical protein